MKRTVKITGAGLAAVLLVLSALSCGKLDVVGTDSARAFGDLLKTLPPDDKDGEWLLAAPDGAAYFAWTGESASIIFDVRPFVNAGLDVSAFDNIADGLMLIGRDFRSAGRETTEPLADFERIVKTARGSIGYHAALDHYGVNLGDGTMFEWAKDMTANDKDIVFVLNPEPFIAAGVDPASIEGWVFARVTVDNENGKPVEVDKILKPFNLK